MAGRGAGEGDRPRKAALELTGKSNGEPAAADENDDLLEPGRPLGGFMLDRGVGVKGIGVLAEACMAADPGMTEPLASGSSEARVMTDPASDAVEQRRAMDGRIWLKEGGRELLISMLVCNDALPDRSRTKGAILRALFRCVTADTCTELSAQYHIRTSILSVRTIPRRHTDRCSA